MIKIGSKKVPNLVTELSIEQFEKVSSFVNDEKIDTFERWIKTFVYLGADEDELNELEFSEFKELVRKFNDTKKKTDFDYVKEVEIDGYTYRSFETEFKMSVRDLRYIEKMISKNNKEYLAHLLAVIYKRTDLSSNEHYTEAHIKHKAKLFKKQPASLAIPFAMYVGEKLSSTAEKIKNENTEVVE